MTYTPNKIAGRMYQGSKPPPGNHGFDVIVLMAEEYQPKSHNFPGTRIIHAPILDNPWGVTNSEYDTINQVTSRVVEELCKGRKVLVTCNAGLNRSGVITGLAWRRLNPKIPASHIIGKIRQERGPHALSNRHFEQLVRRG